MEIYQNTLLKIVARQGSDSDRKYIIPTSGEPVYTTDTKRLFVGDGTLSGGHITGNLFKGDFTGGNPSVIEPAEKGDLGYDTDSRRLYRLKFTNSGSLTSWSQIGGVYVSGDDKIIVENDNEIKLAPLSAGSLSYDIVNSPLFLDGGRISLPPTLPLDILSTNTITISSGLGCKVSGVDQTGVAMNSLSTDMVITSNQLHTKYDGTMGASIYSRGITTTKLSAGSYLFTYGPLPTSEVIPVCQLYGTSALGFQPRVISANATSCVVEILSSTFKADSGIFLTISY